MRLTVLALAVVLQCYADLPVHCPHHTIKGTWEFSMSAGDKGKTLMCNKPPANPQMCFYGSCYKNLVLGEPEFKVSHKVTVVLSDPNVATVTDAQGAKHKGTWTVVYDEGFQVNAMGKTFFGFSKFANGKSICAQTWPGWHRDVNNPDKASWGCYTAKKSPDAELDSHDQVEQAMQLAAQELIEESTGSELHMDAYKSPPMAPGLSKVYRGDHDFVAKINGNAAISWRAKVYPQFVGKTMAELQRMSGYKPTRNAFKQLRPKGVSFLQVDVSDLPASFDWRNKEGQNYVDNVVNQGSCGSCYAVASVSMINSRVRILTKNRVKAQLGYSQVLHCNRYSQGCAGGFPFLVEKYGQEFGFTKDGVTCALSQEELEMRKELGESIEKHPGNSWIRVKDFGYVGGYYGDTTTEEVMRELHDNGPVAVGINGGYELMHYESGVLLETAEGSVRNDFTTVDHAVLLVGWGADKDGKNPHWILKNSFGADWGEKGFFRIPKDGDKFGILSLVSYATPVLGGSNYFNEKKRVKNSQPIAKKGEKQWQEATQ